MPMTVADVDKAVKNRIEAEVHFEKAKAAEQKARKRLMDNDRKR